jgi:uncharacterized protein (TIGR00297 family)
LNLIGLNASGSIAAAIIGAIAIFAGGWDGVAVLFAFFIPSTLLSRVGRERKRGLVDVAKTGARDAWQVAANGGVAAAALLLSLRFGAPMLAAFAGAFAAASADTWATEIGTLVRAQPRDILRFKPLPTGLSGGITWQGMLAQAAGAAFVALVAWALHVAGFVPVFIAGFGGALIDSMLGASVQALRYCPACERPCETNPHHCGTPAGVRRGFTWLENDAVNFAATLSGALIALALYAV